MYIYPLHPYCLLPTYKCGFYILAIYLYNMLDTVKPTLTQTHNSSLSHSYFPPKYIIHAHPNSPITFIIIRPSILIRKGHSEH